MKDFFEDLGKRLGSTAETVTNRAGEAIEIQRLKSQIRGLARGNAVDLMELGRTIYDRYKAGEEVEENAKALCDAISDREATIEDYEKKISRIRGSFECPNCGKMVAKDMAYCPYCGEKTPEESEKEQEAAQEDTAEENPVDNIKEKTVDVAEKAAKKAEKVAKKAGEAAKQAADKTGKAVGKAAEKVEKMAEKAAGKTGEMAEKAAEKAGEMAEKASEKISEAVNNKSEK